MEGDHLSSKKVIKDLQNLSKIKLWARVPTAVNMCLGATHIYR